MIMAKEKTTKGNDNKNTPCKNILSIKGKTIKISLSNIKENKTILYKENLYKIIKINLKDYDFKIGDRIKIKLLDFSFIKNLAINLKMINFNEDEIEITPSLLDSSRIIVLQYYSFDGTIIVIEIIRDTLI